MGTWVIAIAITMLVTLLPRAAAIPIARMNEGNAWMVSMIRIST